MRVLVACEESQRVALAFRALGHDAYSCDLKPCSGGFPEFHYQCDVDLLLVRSWDLVIAHPPCTYLTFSSGIRLLNPDHSIKDSVRYALALEAKRFFMHFFDVCDRVCIENPPPLKCLDLPPYNQVIQPFYFGDPYTKRTCLWLKNLPPLVPTDLVEPVGEWTSFHRSARIRSQTFPGIAAAMAAQWS